MGQLLHDCARRTTAVRRAIQHSQESLLTLAERYGINPKTVHKWRKRSFAHDAPMAPKQRRSTTLSVEEEANITDAMIRSYIAEQEGEPVHDDGQFLIDYVPPKANLPSSRR